jgi:hypothetical protein
MGAIGSISSQHTPVMNQRCWHSFINQVVALFLWDENGMGNIAFNVIVVIDWDIDKNAAINGEKGFLV